MINTHGSLFLLRHPEKIITPRTPGPRPSSQRAAGEPVPLAKSRSPPLAEPLSPPSSSRRTPPASGAAPGTRVASGSCRTAASARRSGAADGPGVSHGRRHPEPAALGTGTRRAGARRGRRGGAQGSIERIGRCGAPQAPARASPGHRPSLAACPPSRQAKPGRARGAGAGAGADLLGAALLHLLGGLGVHVRGRRREQRAPRRAPPRGGPADGPAPKHFRPSSSSRRTGWGSGLRQDRQGANGRGGGGSGVVKAGFSGQNLPEHQSCRARQRP